MIWATMVENSPVTPPEIDMFTDMMGGMDERIKYQQEVHKDQPPEYARSQMVGNVVGPLTTAVQLGEISKEQAEVVLNRFNQITGFEVTYESLLPKDTPLADEDRNDGGT